MNRVNITPRLLFML